jgi:hypothetical protein
MAGNPSLKVIDPDAQFFIDHPDRYSHIRQPKKVFGRTPQRAVHVVDECYGEFASLGEHNKSRRRIILWRVPPDHPRFNPGAPQILKIPFLLNADETVEDRDDILLPIIDELFKLEAARLERTTGKVY